MTVREVAERLKRNEDLVRRWLRDGRLQGQRFGRDWMVSERDLARFQRSEPQRRERAELRHVE